tara:strand:+ start:97 stop:516 length:420 start_codon:yes stop_codon:yes gene_type:complete
MATYDVGQIIYVVSSQKMQVMPFVIAEEVVRKTLSGEEVTYLVKKDKTEKAYNLAGITGDVYEDIRSVREVLVQNATSAIDKICALAEQKSTSLAPATAPKTVAPAQAETSSIRVPTDEDIKSFILDDGTKVHVNLKDI